MNPLVFMCEESSAKEFLEGFLPRFLPGLNFICVKHEGKQDLEKSIPKKLRAWSDSKTRFVIIRDNDGGNCKKVKARLRKICADAGRPETLIRIACQELEAWYLGAPEALGQAYTRPELFRSRRKEKFRDPDRLSSPSSEIVRLIPEFRKTDGARRMAEKMPVDSMSNRSRSFQVFADGVRRISEAQR